MKTVAAGLAVGMSVALALTGCAMPERKTEAELAGVAPPAGAAANNAAADDHAMTGSRLQKRTTTDRMLRSVGSRDARDALETAPRPLDASGG